MDTQVIRQISNQMTVTFDDPRSIKLQVKHISLLQKELRLIKKAVNANISAINQNANQSNNDTILSVGLDVFGKRRLAGSIRSETHKQIERQKKDDRQPYLEIKDWIDQLIIEGDRLKLVAEEYILRNSP
jgi:hypothetical protein